MGQKTLRVRQLLTDSIAGVQLVRDVRVVLPRHALPDGRLHQTRQGGEHVDGWIYLQ